jgi:tRNA wybutosine-synthesizing protein 3
MSNTILNNSSPSTALSEAFLHTDLEPADDPDDEFDDDVSNYTASYSAASSSFEHIKLKTLESLYGIQLLKKKGLKQNKDDYNYEYTYNLSLLRDKSPKGSVDEGIRSLVDLLNAHPCFSTLSSCSGRITLFDPAATATAMNGNDDDGKDETQVSKTGKGYGTWLLSCHDKITTVQLYNTLEQYHEKKMQLQSSPIPSLQQQKERPSCLLFQHEPLLLHVAASNLRRAEQLLKIALELGFRESGIILSCKKITVAIRTHGLSLVVPLVPHSIGSCNVNSGRSNCNDSGKQMYSYEYLDELVYQANHRFDLNQEKLKRLEERIIQVLFRPKSRVTSLGGGGVGQAITKGLICDDVRQTKVVECKWDSRDIPQLCLWGHTAVAIPIVGDMEGEHKGMTMVDVLVMGGYGTGPLNDEERTVPSRRSDRVYRLRRYGKGRQWDDCWRECHISKDLISLHCLEDGDDSVQLGPVVHVGGYAVRPVPFSAREGAASCVMPENLQRHSMPLIVLFGGRESPARPKDELIIMSYDVNNNEVTMFSPCDVRGDIPEARWGHSLTALSGRHGRVALLVGGRNEKDVLSSVYVLSCRTTNNDKEQSQQQSGGKNEEDNYFFIWEKISQSIPRFFHCASCISSGNHSANPIEQIAIYGGLFSTALLPQKEHEEVGTDTIVLTFYPDGNTDCILNNIQVENSIGTFGGAMCCITKFGKPLLLCCGGVVSSLAEAIENSEEDTLDEPYSRSLLQAMTVRNSTHDHASSINDNGLRPSKELQVLSVIHKSSSDNEGIDAGSMVHHCCIELPCTSPFIEESNDGMHLQHQSPQRPQDHVAEILLIGGGVPLLAFGPCFAKSHHVQIRLCNGANGPKIIHQQKQTVGSSKNHISSQKTLLFPTKNIHPHGVRQRETNVLFVHKNNAKQVKTALEQKSLLDKNYRMVKIEHDIEEMDHLLTANTHIAIPITKECLQILSSNNATHETSGWLDYVVTSGKYVVPFSSSVLGRRRK